MKKAKGEMRAEYRRETLGRGVRGKYLARVRKGTNLVLLSDRVAAAFPIAEAVNEALMGLLARTEEPKCGTTGPARTPRRRKAA